MNPYQPNVVVLIEDEALLRIAKGFELGCTMKSTVDVRSPLGGWQKTVQYLVTTQAKYMVKYVEQYVVLVIDHDREKNWKPILDTLEADLKKRVFVCGPRDEARTLHARLLDDRLSVGNSPEKLGLTLAHECRDGSDAIWNHEQISHDGLDSAVARQIHRILFPLTSPEN